MYITSQLLQNRPGRKCRGFFWPTVCESPALDLLPLKEIVITSPHPPKKCLVPFLLLGHLADFPFSVLLSPPSVTEGK